MKFDIYEDDGNFFQVALNIDIFFSSSAKYSFSLAHEYTKAITNIEKLFFNNNLKSFKVSPCELCLMFYRMGYFSVNLFYYLLPTLLHMESYPVSSSEMKRISILLYMGLGDNFSPIQKFSNFEEKRKLWFDSIRNDKSIFNKIFQESQEDESNAKYKNFRRARKQQFEGALIFCNVMISEFIHFKETEMITFRIFSEVINKIIRNITLRT